MAVQKKSPYKEIFKTGLFKVSEYGLQQRILNRFYKKPQCSQTASSFTSVGIVDFYPALLVYLFGIILALLVFVVEITVNKYLKVIPKYKFKKAHMKGKLFSLTKEP